MLLIDAAALRTHETDAEVEIERYSWISIFQTLSPQGLDTGSPDSFPIGTAY